MLEIGRILPNSSVLLVTESKIETIDLMDKLVGRCVAIFGMPGRLLKPALSYTFQTSSNTSKSFWIWGWKKFLSS